MRMQKRIKELKKSIPLSRNLTIVIVMAILVTGVIVVMDGLEITQFNVYNDDDDTTTRTTTTDTTTTTTTEPELPPGTWYHLKVMFTWEGWVAPIDYRDIWIGASTLGFIGIDDYTFNRIDSGVWYEFDTFRVEEGAQGYVSMMSMVDPIDMTFSYESELDYNLATAGPWSGSFTFYDSSAPMGTGPAGHIMFSWVLL